MYIPQGADLRSSNTVGFDQREDTPELDEHDQYLIALMKKDPTTKHWFNNPLWLKKYLERAEQGESDAVQASEHSIATTPQQDALLRQSSLHDEAASSDKSASSLSKAFDDQFWKGNNPEQWRRAQMRKL